jgi:hypothetical protein
MVKTPTVLFFVCCLTFIRLDAEGNELVASLSGALGMSHWLAIDGVYNV